jgi:hypothetical protein
MTEPTKTTRSFRFESRGEVEAFIRGLMTGAFIAGDIATTAAQDDDGPGWTVSVTGENEADSIKLQLSTTR